MMESEALKVVAYLKAMWPRQDLPDPTIAGYCEALRALPFDQVMQSARKLVATSKFFPSVAELLAPIADAAVAMEPAEQAWGVVTRAISSVGRYRTPMFDNPAITAAVDDIGWEVLCNMTDDTVNTARAHFMRIYGSYRDTELDAAKSAPLLGREYKRLGATARPVADVLKLVKGGQ